MNDNIQIVDIFWDRMYLHIVLEGAKLEDHTYVIATKKNKYMYHLEFDQATNSIIINITNIKDKEMLSNSRWYIKYENKYFEQEMEVYNIALEIWEKEVVDRPELQSAKPWIPYQWNDIPITVEVGYKLKKADKVFRYGGMSYAYVVTFSTQELRNQLVCCLTSTFMVKNTNPKKRRFKSEASQLKKRMKKRLIYSLEKFINFVYTVMSHLTPKNGKRILLMSETRVPMGGNLLVLNNRMIERGIDKEFKISYFFKKTLEYKRYKIFMIWLYLAFKTAWYDYIFVDDFSPFFKYITPHKKTKLIQVWHAGVGFKSVGYARFGEKGSPYPFDSPHRKYAYTIVGGEALQEVYAETFGVNKETCLPFGVMRIDGYMEPEKINQFKQEFYQEYPQFENKKIILFAPTFRGSGQRRASYPYTRLDLQAIYEMCGDEYVFLIKMHPYIRKLIEIDEKHQDKIFEFSQFPDINQLFYVTEILITDYSSNIYEFSLQRKPIIFYAFDKEKYELIRSVHRTLDEHAAGKVCKTMSEVIDTIKTKDFQLEKLYQFVDENFDRSEGLASDKVIDYILLNKNL